MQGLRDPLAAGAEEQNMPNPKQGDTLKEVYREVKDPEHESKGTYVPSSPQPTRHIESSKHPRMPTRSRGVERAQGFYLFSIPAALDLRPPCAHAQARDTA